MPLLPGEIFIPRNAAEIRDDILTDIRLEAIAQGVPNPPVEPGSDWHVFATAMANVALIQYANIRISEDNGDVLSATGPELDAIRDAYGLAVVPATPATGRVVVAVLGPVTLVDGLQFVLPNGLLGKVSGTQLAVTSGTEISVVTIGKGADANLAADEVVRWVSPPVSLESEAKVSFNEPLTGGADEESDARKRDRILNRLRNVPAGGNWGFMIETALNSLATLQYAFIYPALGGPASVKVAVVKDVDPDNLDFSRQLGSGATAIVRGGIHDEMPSPMEIVVQSVADESADVGIQLQLPDAAAAGGNGLGWKDAAPWPPLVGGDAGRVSIAINTAAIFRVTAVTATSPVAGQTHIVIWSDVDQKFNERLITAVAGGSGAWDLTLDAPAVDSQNSFIAVGAYIGPSAVNSENYGDTWGTVARGLGPGENTADVNRVPRSLRHPFVEDEWNSSLTIKQLKTLIDAHEEIIDAEWSFRSLTTPTVPASVSSAPNILRPRHFGIYSL